MNEISSPSKIRHAKPHRNLNEGVSHLSIMQLNVFAQDSDTRKLNLRNDLNTQPTD
jgi:hypothetical protein